MDFCRSSGVKSSSQRLDAVALGQSTMTSDLSLKDEGKGLMRLFSHTVLLQRSPPFNQDEQWKHKTSEFDLSQLTCWSTTTDGLTAMTPPPSTFPCVIIVPSSLLLIPPWSHHPVFPSCLFSPLTFFPNHVISQSFSKGA